MKKDTKKAKKIINDKKMIVVMSVVIFITIAILCIIKLYNKDNINVDSPLITELHSYFNSEGLKQCDGLFNYSDDLVDYDKVSSDIRLCTAYHKIDDSKIETKTMEKEKKSDLCKKDGMVFRSDESKDKCTYQVIKKELIDDEYKKIFGKEIENNKEFKADDTHICYLKDDYYYCGLSEVFTYTLGNESTIIRNISNAKEEGSEIIIYDYFIKLSGDTCYKNYTTQVINKSCSSAYKDKYGNDNNKIDYKFLQKYGTKYKHIYKRATKDKNSTYYWVSSKPLN